jgi:hypothetical protein
VEAMFAGPADSVDGMVRACGVGPLNGHVQALDQRDGTEAELSARGSGEKFACLPTV